MIRIYKNTHFHTLDHFILCRNTWIWEGKKAEISVWKRTAKQTSPRSIKTDIPPLNSPVLEMLINRAHLSVPDIGRAKLLSASQNHPSNTLCPFSSGHPHSASLIFSTSPRPPTQTLIPWRRPQTNEGARNSWMGPELAFVWSYCRVPLLTQSLTIYVFLSLNCIGL